MDEQNDILFTATDYCGRSVTLSQITYEEHIEKRHQIGGAEELFRCITDPLFVYTSRDYDEVNAEVFYKIDLEGRAPLYTTTIVQYDDANSGTVKTAYYSKKVKGVGDDSELKYFKS